MADDTVVRPEERAAYTALSDQWLVRGGGVDIITVEPGLSTEEMVLNIGPQHPSTHGVLRIVLALDGEVIVRAEPVIGYMHRSVEKLAEVRDVRQIGVLMNRHDWLSSFNNELGFYLAVEKLCDIEVPERAQWIRTMFAEWNRVLNHLMFTGSFPLELGAMTPMFYAFREREMIQALLESATGGRMHFMFCRAGGLKDDLPRGFLKQSAECLKWIRKKLVDFEDLIMGNEIIHARTKGIGILSPELAVGYGASGPVLHASGVPMDPRKDDPYCKYGEVEFDVPIGATGDAYDRLWVLVQRMWESCKIVEQCMDRLPPGPYVTPKVKPEPKLPEGEVYQRTENPLGLMGYYLVGDGSDKPYRLKLRTASFSNVAVLPALLPSALVADLIAILGSVFFVVGDVDR
ncbi:MAG TPA: NADH-quinone oxidoreductase subunit D [Actinomycetota bacterium]|nr:NADH-quinone oxidoreductase subunit D [Actinomycetota bacterium]